MISKELRDSLLDLKCLAALPKALREKAVDILVVVSEPRSVPKGGVWLREGEPTKNKGFILLKGTAVIKRSDAPPLKCKAPELLGEMMQFNPAGVRTATVSAGEDSIVMRFMWEDFWAIVEKNLQDDEAEKIRDAMKELAWEHLTG